MPRIAPTEYMPDVAIPPGATIREMLGSLGMTQAELAERMGRPPTKVNEIIQGKKAVTVDTAIALERVLAYPADFWLNLEKNYRLTLARLQEAEALERDVQWMRETIPVAELVKRELITRPSSPQELLGVVLGFFGVGSIKAWTEYWETRIVEPVEFRRSEKQAKHLGRVAAWLRIGELDAQEKQCQPFDKRKFRVALHTIRAATVKPRSVFEPLLQELTKCGVVVSVVKQIPGAGISGATRWFGVSKAHIQLSLLFKTDDEFWFTFFHEAGHVLLHDKGSIFLTEGQPRPEGKSGKTSKVKDLEASRFAANFLIPPAYASRLNTLKTREAIVSFAKELGIAPGIVVGQLQHAKHLTPKHANFLELKRKHEWNV